MATALDKNRCVTCGKEKALMKCGGCSQDFCFNHMTDHRQELNERLDEVEVNRDLFRQTLTEQTTDPQKHALIQEINDWERDQIKLIRETAEEARQTLVENTIGNITQIEIDLNKLNAELRQSREENDFYETDLRHWNEELTRLTKELVQPSNIHLRQDTKPFISKISVDQISSKCISHTCLIKSHL